MATGEEDKCELLKLSHDEVSIVTHELCDPLLPLLAVRARAVAHLSRGRRCRCPLLPCARSAPRCVPARVPGAGTHSLRRKNVAATT